MISLESVNYSLRNLLQRKARSLFTILSIFIGITTLFIFTSFGWGLFDYVGDVMGDSAADKILIQPPGGSAATLDTTFRLEDSDVEAIEKTRGVIEASGAYFKAAAIDQGGIQRYSFLIGFDPDKPIIMETSNIGLLEGRMFKKDDTGKVLLGYNYKVPDRIFPKPYKLGDKINVQGKDLRVIGFFEEVGNPSDDSQVYISNEGFSELYPDEDLAYSMIAATVEIDEIDQVIERVKKNLRKERGLEEGKEDFFVSSFQDQLEAFVNVFFIIIIFVVAIAAVSGIVSIVNTANTMITSVLERIKEIGVIKSIGARNSDIFKIFLFESSFLGFVSGVIGVFFGWIISSALGSALDAGGWGFIRPHFSWLIFALGISVATFAGGLSGVIPAWKAGKLKPVDALRYE